jgi:peptidoglycan hydrolase CwlO-like protein
MMSTAAVTPVTSPTADDSQILRGSHVLAKSGFQKRIDKLTREKYESQKQVQLLQEGIKERDEKLASLKAESDALRQELEVMVRWKSVALKLRGVLRRGQQHE